VTTLRRHLLFALLAGLALRLFFVLRYPATSGDTVLYEEIAMNWLRHGTFGMWVDGRLTPVDLRMPGYPAFLALVYWLTGYVGEAARPLVMLAQAGLDLFTCILTATLAASMAPEGQRLKVSAAALWLAALCPFLANYVAVPLTEVWAGFFTVAAMCALVAGVRQIQRWRADDSAGPDLLKWLLGGAIVGLGTLFRPETPLLALCAVVILAFLWRCGSLRILSRMALLGVAVLLPLAPWAGRNWGSLHEVQLLTPRYSQLPGELVPNGFIAWEKTWLVRFRDVYLVPWKLDGEPIPLEDVSPSAFDTSEERARVAALFERYNETITLTKDEDDGFAEIARARTARHPLRTYVWIPLARTATMWFTPRIELLPVSGNVFPLPRQWDEDRVDQCVTAGLFFLNVFYVALALFGLWRLWRAGAEYRTQFGAALALIVLYLLSRTAFLTTLETLEPRYTVICFPLLIALGAQAWATRSPSGGRPAPSHH
jgi:hypothetical protein